MFGEPEDDAETLAHFFAVAAISCDSRKTHYAPYWGVG